MKGFSSREIGFRSNLRGIFKFASLCFSECNLFSLFVIVRLAHSCGVYIVHVPKQQKVKVSLMHKQPHTLHFLVTGSGLSKNPNHWTVTLGEHHLKNEDWFEQAREVKAIYLHPQYKTSANKVSDNKLKSIPPDYDVGE